MMEEAGLMGNLVRLSDYVLTSTLAQHAIDTSVALLSSLQPDGSNRVGHPITMHSTRYELVLVHQISFQLLWLEACRVSCRCSWHSWWHSASSFQ